MSREEDVKAKTIPRQARVESVRELATKYETLFQTAHDAILLMDQERFLDCNRRALEMFRVDREELVGATPVEYSPPVQPDGQRSAVKAKEKIRAAIELGSQSFEW